MKTKWKNKLRHVAAGIFLLGLIANVSLSLTDPFVYVGTDLLAQSSSNECTKTGRFGEVSVQDLPDGSQVITCEKTGELCCAIGGKCCD